MTPSSTNTVTTCVRCRKWLTFQSDGVCTTCRNQDKPKGEKPTEKR